MLKACIDHMAARLFGLLVGRNTNKGGNIAAQDEFVLKACIDHMAARLFGLLVGRNTNKGGNIAAQDEFVLKPCIDHMAARLFGLLVGRNTNKGGSAPSLLACATHSRLNPGACTTITNLSTEIEMPIL